MNDLLDAVWDEIVTSKLVVKGAPDEVAHRYCEAVYKHKRPDNKVTLAGVLQDLGEEKVRAALAEQRTEVARRQEAARKKQEQDEADWKERLRQSAEYAERKRAEEAAAAQKKREQEEAERQKREQAELAAKQAEPLFVVHHGGNGSGKADWPFRYRGPEARDVAAAETALRASYPGIDLDLLRLILAGKAVAQQRKGGVDLPQILVVGVPGAGKSVTTRLAAALACSKVVEATFIKELDRHCGRLRGIGNAGQVALVDEVHSVWPGRLQTHIPRHTFAAIGGCVPPVVVMTAKELPPVMLTDSAIARRVILADIGQGARGVKWLETGGPVEQWRDRNPDHADGFISDFLDRFFRDAPPTFEQVAAALGFYPLARRTGQEIAAFAAALPVPNKASRFTGPRWRTVPGKGPLRKQYDLFLSALQERGCRIEQPARDKRVWVEFPPEIIDAAADLPAGKQGSARSKTDDKFLQVSS
jgi:hypothetical protein